MVLFNIHMFLPELNAFIKFVQQSCDSNTLSIYIKIVVSHRFEQNAGLVLSTPNLYFFSASVDRNCFDIIGPASEIT